MFTRRKTLAVAGVAAAALMIGLAGCAAAEPEAEGPVEIRFTWWGGDAPSRRHVLANLGRLIIKPLSRSRGEQHVLGWLQSTDQLAALAARIEAEPWSWVAQVMASR